MAGCAADNGQVDVSDIYIEASTDCLFLKQTWARSMYETSWRVNWSESGVGWHHFSGRGTGSCAWRCDRLERIRSEMQQRIRTLCHALEQM